MTEIWIEKKTGFLDGYSLMEQPNQIRLEVEKEPLDFLNWRFDGSKLVYDPDNTPELEEEPDQLELLKRENEELKARQDNTEAAMLELADVILGGSMGGGD